MKKGYNIRILKRFKTIKLFKPNEIRLSFYINPIMDICPIQAFKEADFNTVNALNDEDFLNTGLFDSFEDYKGNLYSLFDEGVLDSHLTGANLGIYDYKSMPSTDIEQIDVQYYNNIDEDDYNFGYCVLAEGDTISGAQTQIVKTFKGYLDIVKDSEYSIIRRFDCSKNEFSKIYIPQYYIKKYQLRNGDELLCTCKQVDNMMVVDTLFTINQESRYNFSLERPWFAELHTNLKSNKLRGVGEYTKNICNKFKLFEGDNAFMYLTKKSEKQHTLPKLIEEFDKIFDKVIYINTEYGLTASILEDYNISKFCTRSSDCHGAKVSAVLLGAHYARRLMELGLRVAIIVDDIDSIIELDKLYAGQMPVSKTLFNSVKACIDNGSITMVTLISLRNLTIKTYKLDSFYKIHETLGLVIDNNEIDLFKSYRI